MLLNVHFKYRLLKCIKKNYSLESNSHNVSYSAMFHLSLLFMLHFTDVNNSLLKILL